MVNVLTGSYVRSLARFMVIENGLMITQNNIRHNRSRSEILYTRPGRIKCVRLRPRQMRKNREVNDIAIATKFDRTMLTLKKSVPKSGNAR